MLSNIPFSSYIKHIDPDQHMAWNEPLPLNSIKNDAFEQFRFEGWDFSKSTERDKTQENTQNIILPADDNSEEYRNALNLWAENYKKKMKSMGVDLDVAIDVAIGFSKSIEERESLKYKDFPVLKPFSRPPIDRSFQEGRTTLLMFYWFKKWLDEYFEDDDDEEFSKILPSGRSASIVNLTGAMALLAMDKATGAALRGETWATSHLLLDASDLVALGNRMMESEYDYLLKQGQAKKRSQKRHEKTYAIKEFALNYAAKIGRPDLSKNQITKLIYPEVETYAKSVGQPLMERGFKTVYDWILKNYTPPP